MREPVDAARIRELFLELARKARGDDVRIYLSGGSSAVLLGWRPATVDEDVRSMIESRLVEPARLLGFFEQIEPQLYRFPAIDPPSFRRAVEAVCRRG